MKHNDEPLVRVGICAAPNISFRLETVFRSEQNESSSYEGAFTAKAVNKSIELWQADKLVATETVFVFEPNNANNSLFHIHDVTIGINFHWERDEDQCFKGALKLMLVKDKIQVINHVPLESYLESVISSEMRPSASLPLLKAHAVISRGWLLSQLEHRHQKNEKQSLQTEKDEWIKWYDRDDHTDFDVCADDHCQRYQGFATIKNQRVSQAVLETRGEVLMHEGAICDARFSKCCGGVSEQFSSCWDDKDLPYLRPVFDNREEDNPKEYSLIKEADMERWIYDEPNAFCNTHDPRILIQVLNEYDQETRDFFRWRRDIKQNWLQEKLKMMLNVDLGIIQELIPIKRGPSGRIIKLKVVGTKGALVVGKELEIRKLLSETHLYSSAFIIEAVTDSSGHPEVFILKGAGWGHGVGLCQIGAAVMGVQGYEYKEILKHYFKETILQKQFA